MANLAPRKSTYELEAYALTNRKWTPLATLKQGESVRPPPFDAVAFQLDAPWP